MLNNWLILTHHQQQKAVEHIQALIANSMSSSEAISLVASALRAEQLAKCSTEIEMMIRLSQEH
ncbi:YoaH family protein [Candidatus Moranella endobia]|uniref:Uncharacterized protein n=1 Tax=Moranella endobia (strain PCIT) TaxID=903503 RepID=F7XXI8_MOREP|nr:YoaH family protein [Candidatus Moranella endobia]AEI74814.1 putative hypothetical protein MEPCIT_160 [Candidatus Moranella endobia PCIT]